MKPRIYIDGQEGTTGLRIFERFAGRDDIEILTIDPALRKDTDERKKLINASDITFLCLPDAAAKEAVSLVENDHVRIIDASTAHRTADGWAYGFPELSSSHREAIAAGKRIANPGCHASGFIALVEPLVRAGLVARNEKLCAFSLTGYSGGGKKMIADYETAGTQLHIGGRQYALAQMHKHLPEMAAISGLDFAPCFSPIVVPHLSGMEVTVQLFGKSVEAIADCYRQYYAEGGLVRFVEDPAEVEGGFLSSAALSGRDSMEVSVYGNGDRVILVSRFDNLGKGASGAAIQNMNIVLGCDEDKGLKV